MAHRFNTRYGTTFVVPQAVNPAVAARVMDLADPTGKMGKSSTSDAGVVYLLDDADMVRRKVARAVTDAHGEVAYDPPHRPGVSNLVEILAACTREHPDATARRYPTYADLKQTLAQTIVDIQRPLRARYAELVADPGYLSRVRAEGAHRARDRAAQTVRRAKRAIGLSH